MKRLSNHLISRNHPPLNKKNKQSVPFTTFDNSGTKFHHMMISRKINPFGCSSFTYRRIVVSHEFYI